MTILGWSIWGLSCLVFLLFAKDTFDRRPVVRMATRLISVCLLIGLVITATTDISKLHLLWFVPVTFFICRGFAGSIILNRVRSHHFDWETIIEEEARKSHDSEPMLLLPPPPPSSRRFFQLLTKEAEDAIRSRSGELYDAIIKVLIHSNPELFASREDVEAVLPLFTWPPIPIEYISADLPHIPVFPTDVMIQGRHIPVLVTDPAQYTTLFTSRSSTRMALAKEWGGVDGTRKMRKQFIAEGGTAEQFEQAIYAIIDAGEAEC